MTTEVGDVEGETVKPYKVIFQNEVLRYFDNLDDAKAFCNKRLDRSYLIYYRNKIVFGRSN